MKTGFKALVAAAMESVENELPEGAEVVNDAPVTAVDASEHDAAVAQVEESHRDVEAAYADGETLDEVAEGLEAICASLENLSEPLDARSAVYMNIAAESYLTRVGMDMSDTPMIASFENEGATATKLSVDSIKQKIRAIWEAIKRVFVKVKEAIFGFTKSLIDANHALDKRADALEAAVKAAHNHAQKEAEVDLGMLFHRLHVDGKVDGIAHMADVVFLVEDMGKDPGNAIAQSADLTKKVLLQAKDEADIDALLSEFKKVQMVVPHAFSEKEEKDGETIHRTKELPGGVRYAISTSRFEKAGDAVGYLKNMVRSLGPQHDSKHIHFRPESTKAKTLSLQDIEQVAKSAKLVARQGSTFEAHVRQVTADIEKLGQMNAEAKADQIGKAGAEKITQLYSALASAGQRYMRIPLDAAVYSTRVMKGYVAYAEKSLASYEGAKVEEKKDDAAAAA